MTKRIFRAILSVSAATLVIGLVFVFGILHQYFENQLSKELSNEAAYLAVAVEGRGSSVLDNFKDRADRITLVAPDGSVLFDTQADANAMENHLDRKEIQEALQNGTGQDIRHSDTLGERTVYHAVRLSDGNILRVSSTQYALGTIVFGLFQPLAWIFILMLVLSGIFASRAAKKIVAPLNQLDPEHPEAGEPYDEVAPLLSKISRQQNTISRQLAEAKRQQAEFSLITEHMGEGLLVIDARADLLSWNSSALRLLGTAQAQPAQSVLTLNRSAPFLQAVENALSGNRYETVLELDGISCQITANPVLHGTKVAGAVIFMVDITEKLQRETLRREFTANVSHELKTPLTSISGFAEILQNGMVKPEDTQKFAGRIFDEAQRLITLVSDIIKISQLDEGGLPYEKERADLYVLAGEILDRLRPMAERSGIRLQVEGDHAQIETVVPILDEVLYNLCENAVKYNQSNGQVTVSIRQTPAETMVSVADTGIGIPPAFQERIFERFFRVDKSHSREIGGTGLGLSIVKHGAAYLGAEIKTDSTPGQGTTFTLIWRAPRS